MTGDGRIRVVTRGDDAGSCESADGAIAEACAGGLLRNVSVMAPGPTLANAARMLAERPGVCVGLHVTLNAEWDRVKWGPVLGPERAPSLVDEEGYFWPTPAVAQQRGARVEEMLAEIEAQLALVREHGLRPAYMDEHMGVSWPWPELRAGIAALAEREGLVDAHTVPFSPRPELGDVGPNPVERLRAFLSALETGGTYLYVTHPGQDAADMRRFGMGGTPGEEIARERDGDRRAWLDGGVRRICEERGIVPVTYEEAAGRGTQA